MILDYRVYATLYAVGAVAWVGGFLMIGRAKPGAGDFSRKMDQADTYMKLVVVAVIALGFLNFADWLWQ